jgi:hypothetical protein
MKQVALVLVETDQGHNFQLLGQNVHKRPSIEKPLRRLNAFRPVNYKRTGLHETTIYETEGLIINVHHQKNVIGSASLGRNWKNKSLTLEAYHLTMRRQLRDNLRAFFQEDIPFTGSSAEI